MREVREGMAREKSVHVNRGLPITLSNILERHGGTAARASIPVRVVTLHGAHRVRSGPVLVWEPPGYSLFESELSLSRSNCD